MKYSLSGGEKVIIFELPLSLGHGFEALKRRVCGGERATPETRDKRGKSCV